MPKASLNVQCFVEKEVKSIFEGENQPKLLYVSEIRRMPVRIRVSCTRMRILSS